MTFFVASLFALQLAVIDFTRILPLSAHLSHSAMHYLLVCRCFCTDANKYQRQTPSQHPGLKVNTNFKEDKYSFKRKLTRMNRKAVGLQMKILILLFFLFGKVKIIVTIRILAKWWWAVKNLPTCHAALCKTERCSHFAQKSHRD